MSAMTPDVFAEHGLSAAEYDKILDILGREPNLTELGVFSVRGPSIVPTNHLRNGSRSCPPRHPG